MAGTDPRTLTKEELLDAAESLRRVARSLRADRHLNDAMQLEAIAESHERKATVEDVARKMRAT